MMGRDEPETNRQEEPVDERNTDPKHYITIAFAPDADLTQLGEYAFSSAFDMAARREQPFGSMVVNTEYRTVQFDWRAATRADALERAIRYLEELTRLPAHVGSDPEWDTIGAPVREP